MPLLNFKLEDHLTELLAQIKGDYWITYSVGYKFRCWGEGITKTFRSDDLIDAVSRALLWQKENKK